MLCERPPEAVRVDFNLRPLARNGAQETGVFRIGTRQTIGSDAPYLGRVAFGASEWLLCLRVNVFDIRVRAYELSYAKCAAIDLNLVALIHGQR